ncbi:MAG: ABC-F family ATP-binding cassette domain-containing protein [Pseudomonadota bacterium]
MTLLHIQSLGLTIAEPIFTDLSLTLAKGDRLGLVAANGRGKTTLLNCLTGHSDPTHGEIARGRGLRVGYVRQTLPEGAEALTPYELTLAALPAEQADYESWRVDVVLGELAMPYELQHQPLEALSGGWQRMAMLAAEWVGTPDVLLLDEPTNHLDLGRIGQLQAWLAGLPRDLAMIVTSHDRAFLDAVTNRTLFLRAERSRAFPLSFSAARDALDEADAADERRFANDLNKAKTLRRQAAKLKNVGINSGSDLLLTKTKQLTERAERMEAAARPAHQERSAGEIKLTNSGTHVKALLTLPDVEVTAPDGRVLYRTGQKWISPGERVVLLGANGTGKTQLINLAAQAFEEEGPIRAAPSVVPGISDQHLTQLTRSKTPMELVTERFDIGDQRARAVLAGAGVAMAMQDTRVEALSGGQKARLAMLMLRLTRPNFYLLDEPTNHLDIDGQEALEDELVTHGAASLLVSHDRSFLRNVGNRFWWIKGKRLEEVDDPEPFLQSEMLGPGV